MRGRKEINLRVGANIQRARERAGLTQDRLSELIGVTPNHISAIERGVYGISMETLQKLCLALDVGADFLLFGDMPVKEELLLAKRIAEVSPKNKELVISGITALLELAGSN